MSRPAITASDSRAASAVRRYTSVNGSTSPEASTPTGMLTPNGRSVSAAHSSMCSRKVRAPASMSSGIPGIETVPSPPALDTAAASLGVRNGPSPSCTIG